SPNVTGEGDVSIVDGPYNGTVFQSVQTGDLAGAWMPEPYATKMVQAGGHVLVNEADLWPGGKYVTTLLIVRTEFLNAHRDVVKNLIKGLSDSIAVITTDPAKAANLVSKGIEKASGKPIAADLVTDSFKSITFTLDP